MAEVLVVEDLWASAESGQLGGPAYRYALWRTIGSAARRLVFVGLNPSTADGLSDDPTLRRLLALAARERCGRLLVVNLYGLRSVDPRALSDHPDPIGPGWTGQTLHGLLSARTDADLWVAGWGASGPGGSAPAQVRVAARAHAVRHLLETHCGSPEVHCLGRTAAGHPRHPLYLRADAALTRWRWW